MIDISDRTVSSASLPARPLRSSPPPPVPPPKEHNASSKARSPHLSSSPEPSKRRLPRFWQQDSLPPHTPMRADDKTPKRSISLRRRRPSVTPTEANSASPNTSKHSLLSKTLPATPPLRPHSSPLSTPSTSSSSSCLLLDHYIGKNDTLAVHECCDRIASFCSQLENDDNVWKHIDSALKSIEIVLVQTNTFKGLLRRRILELQQQSPGGDVEQVLRDIEKMCNAVTTTACCAIADEFVTLTTHDYAQETSHYVLRHKSAPLLPDYAKMWPDHMDRSSAWFRRHFVGKPYTTLIRATKDDTIIISSVQDYQSSACRVIVRSKHQEHAGHYLIGPNQLMEAAGDHHDLLYHRHAVAAACPQLDLQFFKELNAEASIMAGLEKELLRFDELVAPKHYKFGVLNVKQGQTCEEDWFGNSDMSPDFQQFLDLIGNRVELQGYTGYAGGMDTKSGETGEHTYVARWQTCDIMFHVPALMPLRERDRQHVHRKRYIGNDIVCLVFVEGDGKFDPSAIRSQFLHVYIVVHLDRDAEGNEQWRVQVIRNTNVEAFGPVIPSMSQLKSDQLRDFILLKLISGENAALKSEKFATPNNKARAGMLRNIAALGEQVVVTAQASKSERPRSTGANSSFARRAATPWRSRPSLDVPNNPPLPPMPTPSRSVLRDLTLGLTRRRRRSSGGNKVQEDKQQAKTPPTPNQPNESSRFMKPPSLVTNVMRGRSLSSTSVRTDEVRASQSTVTRSNTFSRRIGRSSLKKSTTATTST